MSTDVTHVSTNRNTYIHKIESNEMCIAVGAREKMDIYINLKQLKCLTRKIFIKQNYELTILLETADFCKINKAPISIAIYSTHELYLMTKHKFKYGLQSFNENKHSTTKQQKIEKKRNDTSNASAMQSM